MASRGRKQSLGDSGPTIVARGVKVPLEDISVDDSVSGWRAHDVARQHEIKESLMEGLIGHNIFRDPQLVRQSSDTTKPLLDPKGLAIIGDGLQFINTLVVLHKEWKDDGSPEDDEVWAPKLRSIFVEGVTCDWVTFAEEGQDYRRVWYTSVHDEESNRYRVASVASKVSVVEQAVKRKGSEEEARQYLLSVLGSGARSRIGRWVRAWKHLPSEVVAVLPRFLALPQSYIWDNAFLMGQGASGKQRLPAEFSIIALELLAKEVDDGSGMNLEVFKRDICHPLLVLHGWKTTMVRTFGALASDLPAFQRLIQTLCSKGGLAQVLVCMASKTKLHGNSDNDIGIKACHDLVKMLNNKKAGEEEKKKAIQDASSAGNEQEAVGGDPDDTAADVLMVDGAAEVAPVEDPDQMEADKWAMSESDHVHVFRTPVELKEALAKNVLASQSMCVLVDAATSRLKISSAYLEVAKEVLTDIGTCKFSLALIIGPRLDLLDNLHKRACQLFKSARVVVMQLTAGPTQRVRALPSFLLLVHHDASLAFPYSAELMKFRATSLEQTRLRCMSRTCHLRSDEEKALLVASEHKEGAHDTKQELAQSDCEVEQWDEFAPGDAIHDDEGPDDQDVTADQDGDRDFLVDHWPFARPIRFYEALMRDVMHLPGMTHLVVLTTSAHPASWIAGRGLQSDVYVLLDKGRVRSHSVLHGRQVAVNYWTSVKLRELQKFSSPDKKRPLIDADLQFIEVPCKVEDQQMTEWFDKACDPDNQWSCVDAIPSQLESKLNPLLEGELNRYGLVLQQSPASGKGVFSTKTIPEGDCIMEATCLFFTDIRLLLDFVRKKPEHADACVKFTPILKDGKTTSVYGCFLGGARYVNDYIGVRKSPNACWRVDFSRGMNQGCIILTAVTKTGCGIASRQEIVVAYGQAFDHSNKKARISQYFSPQRDGEGIPGAPSEPTPKPPQAPPAKPSGTPGPPPKSPQAPPVKPPQAPPVERPQAPPAKPPQAPPANPLGAATGPPPKPPAPTPAPATAPAGDDSVAMLCEVADPPLKVMLGGTMANPYMSIVSLASENKKLKKNSILMWLPGGKMIRSANIPENGLKYEVSLTSSVFCFDSKNLTTLKELIKTKVGVTEVHGYQSFAAGLPGKLVAEGASLYLSARTDLVMKANIALTAVPHLKWLWSFSKQGNKLVPVGVGLLSVKQLTLVAGREHRLPM